MSTFVRVRAVAARIFDVPEDQVLSESVLGRDIDVDSLYLVQFFMGLEDEFGISVDEEDAMQFRSIGEFVDYVEGQLSSRGAAVQAA